METIEAVSETTRLNFYEVERMPAVDFLFYLRYINEKRRRENIARMKEEIRMRAKANRRR